MTQLPIAVCRRDLRPKLLPGLSRFQALIESMLTSSWALLLMGGSLNRVRS